MSAAVPPSIRPAIGAANDTAEGIIDLAEDIFEFHPKPGGMVDQHRKKRHRDEIATREAAQEAERVEERGYQAVKVTPLSPEVFSSLTYTLQPGGKQQVLPHSPYRHRAIVMLAIPNNEQDRTQAIVAGVATTIIPPAGATITGFAITLAGPDASDIVVTAGDAILQVQFDLAPGQLSMIVTLPRPLGPSATNALFATATASAVGHLTLFYVMTQSANVILAKDDSTALGGSGFILPPNVPVDLRTRAQVVAFNPLSVAVQISVASEIYAPEK